MASLKVEAGDTTAALEYITMGRNLYEDNKGLIATELNLYLSLNKPNILIDRLSAAIESDPYNEQFYFNRGSLYHDIAKEMTKQGKNTDSVTVYEDRAIADYEKALEINAEYGDALYNLGALYVARGTAYVDKANSYGLNEKAKTDEALKISDDYYKKAVPYLELALEMDDQNKGLMQVLMQLYLRMEETEKWKAMKERAEQ
jgi:tetratricopeptide (TPR) repeat protein